MNIDDDDYFEQSTTACCPRQTIPDSCGCLEGCGCMCLACNCTGWGEEYDEGGLLAGLDVQGGIGPVVTETRLCARCRKVLAGEDDEGWYYEIPGGRVYWCDDAPHLVIAI